MTRIFVSRIGAMSALFCGVLGWAGSAHAQRMSDARVPQSRVPQSDIPRTIAASSDAFRGANGHSPFTRIVTLTMRDVSLKRALNELATSAAVLIQYRDQLIEAYTSPVSVQVSGVPLGDVLTRLLAPTPFRAVMDGPARVTVVERQADAQATGTVTGKVTNGKTGKPVAGATILLDAATRGVVTDADGAFTMPAPVGAHAVQVRAIGFVRHTTRMTVAENTTVMVNVALEPSASVLDEVVVTGTVVATERKAVSNPITVITAQDIAKRGITRVDQLFRGEVPGVLALDVGSVSWGDGIGQSAQAKIYTRGTGSVDGKANPMKTYVDGVEMLDPTYIGTIDPQSIERIEIITGPQAATLYGSGALGGVMQIFTKRGNGRATPDLTLNVKYGTMQSNLSQAYTPKHEHALSATGGTGPDFSYSGTVSYEYTGQWQPALYARTVGASIGATHRRGPVTVGGSYALRVGENGTQGFGGIGPCARDVCGNTPYTREYLETGEAANTQFIQVANEISQRISHSTGQTFSLNLDVRATPIWQHHFTIGRNQTNFEMEPEAPKYFTPDDSVYQTESSIGQRTTASYDMTVAPRVGPLAATLTLGANGTWSDQVNTRGCLVTKDATSYFDCYTAYTGPTVTRLEGGDSWGGFGSVQLGFFDRVFLSYGLRGERNPNYGSERTVDWTPTVGGTTSWDIGELTVKVLGSYGRATRPPVNSYRKELVSMSGNYAPSVIVYQYGAPELRPEYSRGPQGGIELYYGNVGSLTINHYRQTVTDLIQRVLIDSVYRQSVLDPTYGYYVQRWQYMNTAKVRQQGWDGTASVNVSALTLKGTYSWSDSRVLSLNPLSEDAYYGSFSLGAPGELFAYIPTHTGNIVASYARGGISMTWVANYVGTSTEQMLRTPELWKMSVARIRTYLPRVRSIGVAYQSKPGYVKSDLIFSQRLSGWATATLNIMNAGNSYDSDLGQLFPTLGRTTLFGLSLRYPTSR